MGMIGELEQKAGIGSSVAARTAFWLQFHHLQGQACLDAGVAELKRMIAERDGTAVSGGKIKRQSYPDLDAEQVAALQDYATRHGRRWKSILNNVWMGGAPYDDGGILRGLRNTHGPTWLQSSIAQGKAASRGHRRPTRRRLNAPRREWRKTTGLGQFPFADDCMDP